MPPALLQGACSISQTFHQPRLGAPTDSRSIRFQAAHDCPASDPNTTSQTTQRATQTQSTSFKSFLPDSDRPVIRPERIDPRSKNAAALELLKKNFPSTSSQKQSKSTSQLKKPLNPVLAGRILKQKATPADPKRPDVPLDRRRYLNISIPPKSEQTPVWLDKVGKSLF